MFNLYLGVFEIKQCPRFLLSHLDFFLAVYTAALRNYSLTCTRRVRALYTLKQSSYGQIATFICSPKTVAGCVWQPSMIWDSWQLRLGAVSAGRFEDKEAAAATMKNGAQEAAGVAAMGPHTYTELQRYSATRTEYRHRTFASVI